MRPRALVLAPLLLSAACRRTDAPSGTPARDAAIDASRAASTASPVVLAGDHALEHAFWAADGALVATSRRDVFRVAPEAPDEITVEPVPRRITGLAAAAGAASFVTIEEGGDAVLWDARTLSRKKVLAPATEEAFLSPDGRTVAAYTCATTCAFGLFDAATGARLGTLPRFDAGAPGDLAFSDDGAYVVLSFVSDVRVADARSGQELLRRRGMGTGEGGEPRDLFEVHGTRYYGGYGSVLEVVDLAAGKPVAKATIPRARGGGRHTYAVDAGGGRIAAVDGGGGGAYVWNVAGGPGAVRTYPWKPPADACSACDVAFHGDRLHISSRILDLTTGRYLTTSEPEEAPPVAGRPGARKDGRYVAKLADGAVRLVDAATRADVGGIGPRSDTKVGQFRRVAFRDGLARVAEEHRRRPPVWLTQRRAPNLVEPVVEDGMVAVRTTETNVFVVENKKPERIVTIYDHDGKELRRERVAPFDAMVEASKQAILLRQPGCEALLCEASAACRPVALHGFVHAFAYPWAIVHPRAYCDDGGSPRLVDVRTSETKEVPACAGDLVLATDAPLFVCSDKKGERVLRGDGTVVRELPPSRVAWGANRPTGFFSPPFRFALGVENEGLEPGERTNLETGERVPLFFGDAFAIATFEDGGIELFGDRERAATYLACVSGRRLVPFRACRADHEVTGRF